MITYKMTDLYFCGRMSLENAMFYYLHKFTETI